MSSFGGKPGAVFGDGFDDALDDCGAVSVAFS